MKTTVKDTRKAVWRIGCSGALMFTLNNEFGYPSPGEEKAAAPLSGGILQSGNQCGMIWGAVLASGSEAGRRFTDKEKAKELALLTAGEIVDSFRLRTSCVRCRDFTRTDFSKPLQMIPYMLFRSRACFRLAGKWAAEATATSQDLLNRKQVSGEGLNCASETAAQMRADERIQVMVAGMAGGIGLTGEGCGALGAAVYVRALKLMEQKKEKSPYSDPELKRILRVFKDHTGSEFNCRKICDRRFSSPADHARYIRNGGCRELIQRLANA